ncbi:Enolase-phosphatase E1 [Erysiphe neolycopersici]|uniref:Enolase-phosphatase E1 n=1 Tax=Erysiphe neolycopersici TaxID=212602 RepID=A0A420HX17_9PEZI|nr:Enolase-phosphatase E1 [Erysiphe neolycopersici]
MSPSSGHFRLQPISRKLRIYAGCLLLIKENSKPLIKKWVKSFLKRYPALGTSDNRSIIHDPVNGDSSEFVGDYFQFIDLPEIKFPYALTALESKLSTLWTSPSFQPYLEAFPATIRTDQFTFLEHIRSLMSNDVKDPNLKNLQGYLWLDGYESGSIRCPLFPDVAPMLQKWHDAGLFIFIYSSGSVAAQKLLFQYTQDNPDLRSLITGYFDTINAGPKTLSTSYTHLIAECNIDELKNDAHQWLFFSDRIDEVNAAVTAGMKAIVVAREGNAPISSTDRAHYQVIESLDQVEIL